MLSFVNEIKFIIKPWFFIPVLGECIASMGDFQLGKCSIDDRQVVAACAWGIDVLPMCNSINIKINRNTNLQLFIKQELGQE